MEKSGTVSGEPLVLFCRRTYLVFSDYCFFSAAFSWNFLYARKGKEAAKGNIDSVIDI